MEETCTSENNPGHFGNNDDVDSSKSSKVLDTMDSSENFECKVRSDISKTDGSYVNENSHVEVDSFSRGDKHANENGTQSSETNVNINLPDNNEMNHNVDTAKFNALLGSVNTDENYAIETNLNLNSPKATENGDIVSRTDTSQRNDYINEEDTKGNALSRSLNELEYSPQAQPILDVKQRGGNTFDWKHEKEESGQQPHVYRRRWIIVSLFCLYSMSNAYQWIHLNIIANIIIKYYNQSLPEDEFQMETTVDWLSMIYMLAYIPLIFPATFLLDKKGLRIVAICGAFLNAIGAWLKVACLSPDRFPVLMFAQTICAIAQIFILGLPARIAAVWFGPNEVSTATSIGVFGNQVGVAVGFLIPPVIVENSDDLNVIGQDLSVMFYSGAGYMTALLILVLIVFKEKPPLPPSKAQMLAQQNIEEEHYGKSLLRLITNKGFVILTITYGVNTGCYYAISTLLNPIVLEYFPGHEASAGQIGLTIVLAGVLGSIVAGIWLDKTRTYKGTTVGIYFLSMAGMIAFTFTMDLGVLWVVFLCAGSLGFFMTGYLPVGFEFAAEITYPESEGTSSGLLNASAQFFGIILTIGCRAMINRVGTLESNILICAALLVGTIATAFIAADYKRQNAGKEVLKEIENQDLEIEAPLDSEKAKISENYNVQDTEGTTLKT